MATTTASGRIWARHELVATGPEAAGDFYDEVLGTPVGAARSDATATATRHWVGTIPVTGLDGVLARAERAGGRVMDAGGGSAVLVRDPCGAVLGLCEEGDAASGAGLSFCWSELIARDLPTARAFYREVLGWTSRGVDLGDVGPYRMFVTGGPPCAPAGRDVGGLVPWVSGSPHPPLWLHYVAVAELDVVFNRVGARGGHALVHPAEIPGIGRYAVVADPAGAVFGLFRAGG